MTGSAPLLDGRDQAALLAELYRNLPGYTPAWSPQGGTASAALLRIFARYLEILVTGLNQAPDRNLLAFLDTLGISLLPAQGARAPLVFGLMDNSPIDATLPANSQVAAPVQPPSPSPLLATEGPPAEAEPVVFATTQTIRLLRARLAALYSLNPEADEVADHSALLHEGFTLFDQWQPVEHALYLGHDSLLALAGVADIRLSFALGSFDPATAKRGLEIAWEYLSQDGWLPLAVEEDRTEGLTQDGLVILRKTCGPDAREETIHGHTSFWLRGRLLTPLPPQSSGVGVLPVIDTVRVQVGFTKSDLEPEAAFTDLATVDTANSFYPFGKQPAPYITFYLASKEAFQRRGARLRIEVILAQAGQGNAALTWEYHDGKGWRPLAGEFEFQDTSENFTVTTVTYTFKKDLLLPKFVAGVGTISFRCPPDWGETTVNGVKNYWLRARIDSGDYGHPIQLNFVETPPKLVESTLQPPVVAKLTLQYTYQTPPAALDHCLAFNDFVYRDHSHACRWPRQPFDPFQPIADALLTPQPALYFGFDQPLPAGLVSLYLSAPPPPADDVTLVEASAFVWEYRTAGGWSELGVLDETLGFRRSGMIQFIGPADAVRVPGLGGNLFRLRARLKQGERLQPVPVRGIWLNAVWGTHRLPITADALGDSDGTPRQTFYFRRQRVPVLAGESIEVREWAGRGAEWETVVQDVPAEDLRFEYDLATNAVKAVWVRWRARPHLFDSGPADRHCVLERASGWLRFGDGRHGRVPPAGARVVASYDSGGGLAGNVPVGAISELRTGVPYLATFTNVEAATGGAAVETLAAVRVRGPQRLRHRERAVSVQDFEWLAREASPAVARVRCLPITGPAGKGERGWVTLVVVPHGEEAQPQPAPELQRRIRDHLATRAPATVARHIRIIGPRYQPVSVMAEITPRLPEEAAAVEARLLARLQEFLHPLKGGPAGQGWAFGQALYLSHIAALIEETAGVDYARQVSLRVEGEVFDEYVPLAVDALVAPGDHELKLIMGGN
jgi:hypothetical protein